MMKCVEARAVTKSTGRRSSDMSVYVGFGGVALAFLRCAEAESLAGRAEEAAATLAQVRKMVDHCLTEDPQSDCVSFFCGTCGYLAIGLAAASLQRDLPAVEQSCQAPQPTPV